MFELRPHQQDTLNAMRECRKGQVIVPTGGGKTLCMINDALLEFESGIKTIVVVCPRLLLANQLCSDFTEHNPNASILHVHSGDAGNYHSTTKPDIISKFCYYFRNQNKLIFTTYHSLHRIKEAGVKVDTIYFDEAHNSVQKNFFRATEYYAKLNNVRCYFFTATPKHSAVDWKAGMNDEEGYGDILDDVQNFQELDEAFQEDQKRIDAENALQQSLRDEMQMQKTAGILEGSGYNLDQNVINDLFSQGLLEEGTNYFPNPRIGTNPLIDEALQSYYQSLQQ